MKGMETTRGCNTQGETNIRANWVRRKSRREREDEGENKGLIKRMENDGVWCQMCALYTTNKHCQ